MTHPHPPHSTPSIRLISLVLCYSVVVSLFPLIPESRKTIVNASPIAVHDKKSTPRIAKQTTQRPKWRDGELLVRFRQNASAIDVDALLLAQGAQRGGRLRGQSGIERLRLSPGWDPVAAAYDLRSNQLVEFAEPNYLITADEVSPNDPRFSEQWALRNMGANGGHFGSDISVEQAWRMTTGTRRTVIAVIDSGVDFSHPDLRNNQWNNLLEQANNRDDDANGFADDLKGWDFVTNSNEIKDEQGHGTGVAGIIAARGHNAIGISGVMWRASLVSLRVLDNTGTGDIAGAVEAIDYAVTNGAQVINCSWGTTDASTALLEAINRAAQRGVVIVASAGNGGHDVEITPHYPASYDSNNLMAVASTNSGDLLTSFSNWGAAHITIAAPGTDILTTKTGGDYQTISGTSASAPFVTGIVGLIKTLRPWLNEARTREIILRGTRQVAPLSDKVVSRGVVNAAGALEALNALSPAEGKENGNGNSNINGGEHGNTGNGRGSQRDNRPVNGNGTGSRFTVVPQARMQGAPGMGLPNLDELRRKQPTNPKALDPIPSMRCSPHNPRCQPSGRLAAIEVPTGLLAWGLNVSPLRPSSGEISGLVSDSPFRLFWSQPALLTASLPLPQTNRANVALATNGGVASASTTYSNTYPTSAANNGDRKGLNWNDGGGWNDATASTYPDWLQVDFNGTKTIDEIDVFTLQDNPANPVEPTETMTFNSYGIVDFDVQYWDGSAWATVPAGSVTGNNKVWRKFIFTPLTTSKIRVLVNNALNQHSRIIEVEAWGTAAPSRSNVALSTNGGMASVSSTYSSAYPAGATINSDRKGLNWNNGGGWNDATASTYPDWLQIDFNGSKTIDEIDVFTLQDSTTNPVEPTEAMTFTLYGITAFEVQYWDGSAWGTVPGGSVTGNNKVWRKFTFTPLTTSKVRVLVNNALFYHSRVVEVEAWGTSSESDLSGNNYSMARLDPINRIGGSGVDLLSRNANWSLPLLGLKGRAGLDLSLSLSYNSLVWTKDAQSNSIKFDADRGTPSPGFRLGFPIIQPPFYNPRTGKNAYLLITPSGSRVELRQVGTSNVYEAGDSSYLQLTDNGSGNLTLRPTDGSQLSYTLINGQYQCTQIKDRNGNYITINYHPDGRINTITDTLARVITFNYDDYLNLNSITQTWTVNGQPQTHTWATFGWSNLIINTNFTGLTVVGPQTGASIPVLTQVSFADGTRSNFDYTSWGQVYKIRHYAEDNHLLSYTGYNLPGSEWLATSAQTDCPRLTESKVWAEQWNGDTNGVPTSSEEATTSYSTAADGSSGQATMPDGTIYKEMFASSGWQKGLTTGTEAWSGGLKKKWTTVSYTQTDTSLNYQQNPRVIETNVYDVEGNRKRTTIEYGSYAQWGLPYLVKEYAADGNTPIRHTFTDYNLSPEYINSRIIGLVSAVHMSDGAWQVKVGYEYDAGGDQMVATSAPATQHEASYNASFLVGRANLTLVSRYDVYDIGNESKKTVTRFGYNNTGSLVFTRDHLGHQSNISYTDSFSDATKNSLNTFAYPTKVTPPLGAGENAESFSSTSQYNYDFGAVTLTQGPAPAGQNQGAVQTFEYDSAERITKVNNLVNNAYRRWVYDPSGSISIFETIKAGAPEAYSAVVFNGMGRVRGTSADNPNSTGLYSGQYTYYDVMGRVFKQFNPTEMNNSWTPTGDDSSGWVGTEQTYDWQGRPRVTTNPDGTIKEATYGGCGCAGGEVVTVSDEGTLINGVLTRRQRKVFSDVLGRPFKTQVLSWDGTTYSTSITIYNARDQVKSVKIYQGAETGDGSCPTGTCQETVMDYDGYGRLIYSKAPEQTSPTVYTYNSDDTPHMVTDGRGATTTFGYNSRHQVTGITFGAPADITQTAPVSFQYDAAGNRTQMTDGLGSTTYAYDRLSRLIAETRSFTDVGSFTLSYGYSLAGQVTSITDPWGVVVDYTYDHVGQLTDVTGSGYAGVTNYASNMRYRAWGALKTLVYGNGMALSASHNSRLQLAGMEVSGGDPFYGYLTGMRTEFQYNAEGSLRAARDLLDERMDRAYAYDQVGRLKEAYTGPEAREYLNGTPGGAVMGPYRQTYQYDVWGQMTTRTTRFWSQGDFFTASYLNGRNQNPQWQYDNAGNIVQDDTLQYTWDAAGRNRVVVSRVSTATAKQEHDGLGQVVKRGEGAAGPPNSYHYFLRSSVLGGRVITELYQEGLKIKGYVYAGGEVLAEQLKDQFGNSVVVWRHDNPLTGSRGTSNQQRAYMTTIEADPMGVNVGVEDPFIEPEPGGFQPDPQAPMLSGLNDGGGGGGAMGARCYLDGMEIGGCERVLRLLDTGTAVGCPNNDCRPRVIDGRISFLGFNATNGRLGYWHWKDDYQNPQPASDDDVVRIRNQGRYVWNYANSTSFSFRKTQIQKRRVVGLWATGPDEQWKTFEQAAQQCDISSQFTSGKDVIKTLQRLSGAGPIDDVNIFSHGFPAGVIGGTSNSIGIYIEYPAHDVYTNRQYTYSDGVTRGINYLDYFNARDEGGGTRNSEAATVADLANAIGSGSINIALGGSINFFGCQQDDIASHLSYLLTRYHNRGDISVTGGTGDVTVYTGIGRAGTGRLNTYRYGSFQGSSVTRRFR
jgi:YD repeat-containing protein